jgi:hypothetical protein
MPLRVILFNRNKHMSTNQSGQQDQANDKKSLIPNLSDLQTQFQNQVEAAKNLSHTISPKIDQGTKELEQKLESADVWAIAQANQVIEQGEKSLENLKTEAQKKYAKTVEQAAKQVGAGRDRLQKAAKNILKSALDKIN